MKSLIPILAGLVTVVTSAEATAQTGQMMNGGGMMGSGWMGGYGGYWGPILLVALIGVVIWAILNRRK